MKYLFFFFITALIFSSCCRKTMVRSTAVQPYETSMDGQVKILRGIVNRKLIETDTSFNWFHNNYALTTADTAAANAFRSKQQAFQMVVFFGTWCEDSQNLLPVFYRLCDKAGYPDNSITLIAVSRDKTTLGNLNKAFHITNVPAFIVMKDGREAGRVVEYGKSGSIEKDLKAITDAL